MARIPSSFDEVEAASLGVGDGYGGNCFYGTHALAAFCGELVILV